MQGNCFFLKCTFSTSAVLVIPKTLMCQKAANVSE